MLKKLLLLAGALAALAALSPSVASATWFMNGVPITQNETFQTHGQLEFNAEQGGVRCNIEAHGILKANQTTGTITSFGVKATAGKTHSQRATEHCVTQGVLALNGCTVETLEATGFPWVIHKVNTQQISVTTGEIHTTFVNHFGSPCTPKSIKLFAGQLSLHVAVAEMSAIKKATLTGILLSTFGEIEYAGSVTVTPEGTFGL